mgnify:CR=1 FL=1
MCCFFFHPVEQFIFGKGLSCIQRLIACIDQHAAAFAVENPGEEFPGPETSDLVFVGRHIVKEFKNIEIANLREFIEKKLEVMLKENSTRTDFAQKLQEIINRYNAGGTATENYFDDLVKYAEGLKEEDERHIREGLSADELELYDILKKDKMTQAEEIKVKNAARDLLQRLIKGRPKVLIQDWFKDGQSQVRVKLAIEEVLDKDLPETYEKDLFKEKSNKLYDLVYEYASKGQKWAA